MKKFIFSAVAIMAMAFSSCTEELLNPEVNNPEADAAKKVTLSFVGGTDTKTYIDENNNAYWHESGEYLTIFETKDGDTGNTAFVTSKEGQVSGKKCVFAAEFLENAGGSEYVYNAVYPAKAYVSSGKNPKSVGVLNPAIQRPTLTSFDRDADLLISKPLVMDAQPAAADELPLQFGRIVSIGKMVIKNLDATDPVMSVTLTVPDDIELNGRIDVNLMDGIVNEYGYWGTSNSVTMKYPEELGFTNGNIAIFTCFPCEIPAGGKFTVTVKTRSKKFVKECSIKETGSPLVFNAGKSTKFTVNFAGVEPVMRGELYDLLTDVSNLSAGDKIVVVSPSSGTAMSDQLVYVYGNERRGKIDLDMTEGDEVVEIVGGTQIIRVMNGAESGTFAFSVGNGYLSSEAGKYVLKTVDSVDGYSSWTITTSGGVTSVKTLDGSENIMGYNSGSKFFVCATQSFMDNNTLTPVAIYYKKVFTTAIAPVTNLKANLVKNDVVQLSWNPSANADQYVVTYGGHRLTVTECAARIEGLALETDYTFSVVAKNTGEDAYSASTPVSVDVKTGVGEYRLLTDVSDLSAGDKIVVVSPASGAAMSDQLVYVSGTERRGKVNVPVTDGTNSLDPVDGMQIITLVDGAESGTFAFNVGNDYLSSENGRYVLKAVDSVNEYSSWTITTSGGVTSVKALTGSRNIMGYNSSDSFFVCGSQSLFDGGTLKPVAIYYKKCEQLAQVTGLQANLVKNDVVQLSWNPSANADQYVVTYGGHRLTVTECAARIEGLALETDYTFSVVAKNTGEDAYSASTPVSVDVKTGVGEYVLLTDTSRLKVGDQIVIVSPSSGAAMSDQLVYVNGNERRGKVDVPVTDGTNSLNSVDGMQVITLVDGTESGTFAFSVGNGYLSSAAEKYVLKTIGSVDGYSSWTITIADGVISVKALTGGFNIMGYNSGSKFFVCASQSFMDNNTLVPVAIYYKSR